MLTFLESLLIRFRARAARPRVPALRGGRIIMPLRISGRNISVGPALQERINARVAEALSKYFDGGYTGHASVGKDGFGFRTECVVHLDSGASLEAEGSAADAYESADQAAERIEKRLRRYKRKRKDSQARRGN
jgi:ribosomal subunit interface protein